MRTFISAELTQTLQIVVKSGNHYAINNNIQCRGRIKAWTVSFFSRDDFTRDMTDALFTHIKTFDSRMSVFMCPWAVSDMSDLQTRLETFGHLLLFSFCTASSSYTHVWSMFVKSKRFVQRSFTQSQTLTVIGPHARTCSHSLSVPRVRTNAPRRIRPTLLSSETCVNRVRDQDEGHLCVCERAGNECCKLA